MMQSRGNLMEQSIELNRVMRRPDGSLATEHAYGCIKDLVMGLQFRPGQHLCATRLSDWLDVSPTPVREALHRLSKESLIVNVPGRGFFCRVPTLKEVRDLNRVLEICLRDSILQYTSPERPKELELFPRGASTKLTQHVAGRVAVVRDAFHWLATLSGNIVLSLVANNMIDRTHFIRCVDLRSDAVFEIYDSAHDAIEAF